MNDQTTVLVVEDEESFVEALTVGLEREGFVVEIARDGREALQMFAETNPDIVLLDVMLPGIGGLDVCRQIRETSSVPIIMVTARSAEIDTVVGLEVGAEVVDRLVDGRHSRFCDCRRPARVSPKPAGRTETRFAVAAGHPVYTADDERPRYPPRTGLLVQ